uniref:Uncharacterized protein n=1 Tax=Varanus komodoensis TaxID=61221 RepID=A0A8D2IPK5_VARKO
MAFLSFSFEQFLTKRIPQNPKYQHVKTRLDTGSSMTKYAEKLEEIKRNYRYKKDELFKRLKVTTFAQLVCKSVPLLVSQDLPLAHPLKLLSRNEVSAIEHAGWLPGPVLLGPISPQPR